MQIESIYDKYVAENLEQIEKNIELAKV
jgi:hypothetical protein